MKILNILALSTICILMVSFTPNTTLKGPKLKKVFNGKDLTGWNVEPGDKDNIWWTANKGVLSVKSGPNKTGSILWTDKSYKNFIIQADFKFGTGTIDSGIFMRSDHDQIQIGESGSLKRDMTCSPYIPGKGYPSEAKNIKQLLKLDDWNTIKIKAEGSVYTMWLNGEEVLTYDSDTAIEEGPIGIQLHPGRDMTIAYKNILIAEI
ncbi:MAG: DUF1080 domain-containing protein [Bacteroidota bacterium]